MARDIPDRPSAATNKQSTGPRSHGVIIGRPYGTRLLEDGRPAELVIWPLSWLLPPDSLSLSRCFPLGYLAEPVAHDGQSCIYLVKLEPPLRCNVLLPFPLFYMSTHLCGVGLTVKCQPVAKRKRKTRKKKKKKKKKSEEKGGKRAGQKDIGLTNPLRRAARLRWHACSPANCHTLVP